MNIRSPNSLWSSLIVEELVRQDLKFYINSPGYRSAPIIEAISCQSDVEVKICYDERSAAFFALGYAKSTSRIPVLLCTSGSAVANYLPAVVEAFYSKIPLFIITGDKTEFFQDIGSNQVINQKSIFSSFTCFSKTLPAPFYAKHYGFLLQTIDQCVESARKNCAPIHLNLSFDKPLISEESVVFTGEEAGVPKEWWDSKKTYFQVEYLRDIEKHSVDLYNIKTQQEITLYPSVLELQELLVNSDKVLFVLGEIRDKQHQEFLSKWIKKLPFIAYVDVLSKVSRNNKSSLSFWNHFIKQNNDIDLIIYIGEKVSIENFSTWIDRINPTSLIHCILYNQEVDASHRITSRIIAEDYTFLECCFLPVLSANQKNWLAKILKEQKECFVEYNKLMQEREYLHSFCVMDKLLSYIPKKTSIFIGNSSIIRILNSLPKVNFQDFSFFFNRGASGIDGNIGTAFGIAQNNKNPTWAFIGDLACLHDLSSFSLSKEIDNPLVLCVLNDSSGGIFSYLPVKNHDDYYEKFFKTPHHYNFKGISEMFGWDYYKIDTSYISLKTLLDNLSICKHTFIEIILSNEYNAVNLKSWITL